MIKTCLTHYDLDGVSCAIVLNKVFEFDQILRGGYGRIPELIDQIPDDASIIVSDLVISESDYEKLLDKSKGKLIIIDHHPETGVLKEKYPKHPIYYAEDKAGVMLCYELLQKKGMKFSLDMYELSRYANAYDLFKRKEEKALFTEGFNLNLLFWKYHFDAFFDRFQHGFDGYTEDELKFIGYSRKIQKEMLESANYHEFLGNKSKALVSVLDDSSIINEIPYYKTGYDVYFMITKFKNNINISVRAGDSGLVINSPCKEIEKSKYVSSAGGHPQACGITVDADTPDEALTRIILTYYKLLEETNADILNRKTKSRS